MQRVAGAQGLRTPKGPQVSEGVDHQALTAIEVLAVCRVQAASNNIIVKPLEDATPPSRISHPTSHRLTSGRHSPCCAAVTFVHAVLTQDGSTMS